MPDSDVVGGRERILGFQEMEGELETVPRKKPVLLQDSGEKPTFFRFLEKYCYFC